MVKSVVKEISPQKIIIMPTFIPPHKKVFLSVPAYAIAGAMPFVVRYVKPYSTSFTIGFIIAAFMLLLIFICVIWSHGKLPFADAMSAYVLVAYIIVAMNSIVYVRDYSPAGKFTYLLIFFGAWMMNLLQAVRTSFFRAV
jgi:hypothetical protein